MFKFCLIAMLLMFNNVDMQLEEDDYFDSLFTGTSTAKPTNEVTTTDETLIFSNETTMDEVVETTTDETQNNEMTSAETKFFKENSFEVPTTDETTTDEVVETTTDEKLNVFNETAMGENSTVFIETTTDETQDNEMTSTESKFFTENSFEETEIVTTVPTDLTTAIAVPMTSTVSTSQVTTESTTFPPTTELIKAETTTGKPNFSELRDIMDELKLIDKLMNDFDLLKELLNQPRCTCHLVKNTLDSLETVAKDDKDNKNESFFFVDENDLKNFPSLPELDLEEKFLKYAVTENDFSDFPKMPQLDMIDESENIFLKLKKAKIEMICLIVLTGILSVAFLITVLICLIARCKNGKKDKQSEIEMNISTPIEGSFKHVEGHSKTLRDRVMEPLVFSDAESEESKDFNENPEDIPMLSLPSENQPIKKVKITTTQV